MLDRHVIANMALGRLGANRISSFDEGTTEAVLVSEDYGQVVRECLEDHPWNFAEAAERLSKDVVRARPDFNYSYTRPTDCLAPRYLMDDSGVIYRGGYKQSKSKICTDLDGAWLVYAYRAPENLWSPMFAAAVLHLLTSRMAMALTEVEGKAKAEFDLYMIALARARSRNSKQDTTEVFDTSGLIAWHAG